MITVKAVNIFGFISIGIMLLMLVSLWSGIVPWSFYWPIVIIAGLLMVTRIVLRLIVFRREKKTTGGSDLRRS